MGWRRWEGKKRLTDRLLDRWKKGKERSRGARGGGEREKGRGGRWERKERNNMIVICY